LPSWGQRIDKNRSTGGAPLRLRFLSASVFKEQHHASNNSALQCKIKALPAFVKKNLSIVGVIFDE
jgi:hypothetical protein